MQKSDTETLASLPFGRGVGAKWQSASGELLLICNGRLGLFPKTESTWPLCPCGVQHELRVADSPASSTRDPLVRHRDSPPSFPLGPGPTSVRAVIIQERGALLMLAQQQQNEKSSRWVVSCSSLLSQHLALYPGLISFSINIC